MYQQGQGISLFLPLVLPIILSNAQSVVIFEGCDVSNYYRDLGDKPSRSDLQVLVQSRHSTLFINNDNEVALWQAIRELHPGNSSDSTRLIYRQVDAQSGWDLERLWPETRGVGTTGPAASDLHHVYPSDEYVNRIRGSKYFGTCFLEANCNQPAVPFMTPNDTEVGDVSFLPPLSVRGDIARALFYMDVRYSGNSDGEVNLVLTDCPVNSTNMAFLSQLLEWHLLDPVSDEETFRNQRVCERWQGNRNPFVDNPSWVTEIFGVPKSIPYECDNDSLHTNPSDSTPGDNGGASGDTTGLVIDRIREAIEDTEPPYDSCTVDEYYASLANVASSTRSELEELVQRTHRRQLPERDDDGGDDVWTALIALNHGNETNTVHLVYSQIDMSASMAAIASGWNIERFWPQSRGVGQAGKGFTDLHNLAPSDWTIRVARTNKFFGDCDVAGRNPCTRPATPEAANDTAMTASTFLPPASVRGDIARALFYMTVRYSGNFPNEQDLQLTDCPDRLDTTSMAYLSELLQWHMDDPVSDQERVRNDQVCERWQGNRNPFVDYPELVGRLFGEPKLKPYICGDATESPRMPSSTCVDPGAIMVVGINSDPPNSVALLALENIPGGMALYATDNAWTGEQFQRNEGILELRIPGGGIPAGTVFGYSAGNSTGRPFSQWNWEIIEGEFYFSSTGDTVLLICYTEETGLSHISGISFAGPWVFRGGDSSVSALPGHLRNATRPAYITLNIARNYKYTGPTRGTAASLGVAIADPANWASSSSRFDDLHSLRFEIVPPTIPRDETSAAIHWGGFYVKLTLLALSTMFIVAAV